MDAAARHFKVAQFLTPEELLALTRNPDGDKAMLVVISEYYYGINEFFKRQLAGKRITKVVVFTRDNDESRVKYVATTHISILNCRSSLSLNDGGVVCLDSRVR